MLAQSREVDRNLRDIVMSGGGRMTDGATWDGSPLIDGYERLTVTVDGETVVIHVEPDTLLKLGAAMANDARPA